MSGSLPIKLDKHRYDGVGNDTDDDSVYRCWVILPLTTAAIGAMMRMTLCVINRDGISIFKSWRPSGRCSVLLTTTKRHPASYPVTHSLPPSPLSLSGSHPLSPLSLSGNLPPTLSLFCLVVSHLSLFSLSGGLQMWLSAPPPSPQHARIIIHSVTHSHTNTRTHTRIQYTSTCSCIRYKSLTAWHTNCPACFTTPSLPPPHNTSLTFYKSTCRPVLYGLPQTHVN